MKNRMYRSWGMSLLVLALLTACSFPDEIANEQIILSDFESSPDGWTGGVAEYSTSMEGRIEFALNRTALPSPLPRERMAMKIEGRNLSDDLFMYMKKKVTGLDPTRSYQVLFDMELASNYATNSVGIGGSPGASVFLKAGAAPHEPETRLKDNFYEVTIDKGNQAQEGTEMYVLGHVGAGQDINEYRMIRRNNLPNPIESKPDAEGTLWLCVGTDSGFEGKTILYYDKIRVVIRPVEN